MKVEFSIEPENQSHTDAEWREQNEARMRGPANPKAPSPYVEPPRLVYTHVGLNAPARVRVDENHLTDDQLREKWNREFEEASAKIREEHKERERLRGLGFSYREIQHLRPFEAWEKEPYTPAFIGWIWAQYSTMRRDLPVSKENLEKLKANCDLTRSLNEKAATVYGGDQTRRLVAESKVAHEKAVLAGEKNLPEILTEDQAFDRLKEARKLIQIEISNLVNECWPIVDGIVERLIEFGGELGDKFGGDEIEAHARTDGRFGYPLVFSRTVINLRQLEWRAADELSRGHLHAVFTKLALDTLLEPKTAKKK